MKPKSAATARIRVGTAPARASRTAPRRRPDHPSAAEGDEFEAVGDHRAEQPDGQTEQQDAWLAQLITRLHDRRRPDDHRTDQAGHRESGDARPVPSGLTAQQDVARPEQSGEQREGHAGRIELCSGQRRGGPLRARRGRPRRGRRGASSRSPRPPAGRGIRSSPRSRGGFGRTPGRWPSSSTPRQTPKASAISQSRRLWPRTPNRTIASSTTADVSSRNQTSVVGVTVPKRSLAIAAPTCSDAIEPSTNQIAGIRDGGTETLCQTIPVRNPAQTIPNRVSRPRGSRRFTQFSGLYPGSYLGTVPDSHVYVGIRQAASGQSLTASVPSL